MLRLLIFPAYIFIMTFVSGCTGRANSPFIDLSQAGGGDSAIYQDDGYRPVYALLVIPAAPAAGEKFRILATGGKDPGKAFLVIKGPQGQIRSAGSVTNNCIPYWRLDDFRGVDAGTYDVTLVVEGKEAVHQRFEIGEARSSLKPGRVWKATRGWDSGMETLYSAWINALFMGCGEDASWRALHEVTRDRDRNFLYNYLSLGEDDPASGNTVLMQPDCADNPFYLRAYFAWKLGLPFGYHVCDRGYVHHNPSAGQWITNEIPARQAEPVRLFNAFVRRIADGVHSGTARTALDDENSDYYAVPLNRQSLRPGTVFADPYGHTLMITGWVPQTRKSPGLLLAVDAQPDGTVGIKRFWKGNFMFNTTDVVGEPGFKAFRPVLLSGGVLRPVPNKMLDEDSGYVPFSMQQKKMTAGEFYRTMERLINPRPLDPESALTDLINALHGQLQVRVTSVANGEEYIRTHPGATVSMPSSAAGIFLAGGQWENFSTPNRDLRLLIAMDAVSGFPDAVAEHPGDYFTSSSGHDIKVKLQAQLEREVEALSISYTRSDGSVQKLTVGEVLRRKDAFEMAYNPNDGIEIRWGAPENSPERSTCRRQAPAGQRETMKAVRPWFSKRLHPPT